MRYDRSSGSHAYLSDLTVANLPSLVCDEPASREDSGLATSKENVMDIQSAVLNELFVLHPMIIQGWVTPVKPAGIADGGISKALYDGQAQGLVCLVDPWTELQQRSWIMAADDHVDLYCNGDLIPGAGQTVKPGEETLRQRLCLPHGNLRQGVNRLHYMVTRPSGNSVPSRDLLVLYHLRPAENLNLIIPADVLKDGVSAARAAQGVEFGFTYANRRNHDRIKFWLGDTLVEFDVPDGTAPITHTLFTDTFRKAGDNASAVAEFFVVDQLLNQVKSPEKRLDIHLDRLDLRAPTVKGMTGTNFSPTQPEVRVLVPQGSLLPTDKLSVIWQGATGSAVAGSYTSPQRLVSAGLEIAVPRSVLAYSLGKQVTVTYVVERNGKPAPSLPLPLNILTLPATALISPKIVEADANNFLDVMALGSSNATIHALLHTLIEAGQPCWLSLEGKKADGTAHNLTRWNGLPYQVNATWISQGFWPNALANSYLKQLGHGTTLTIKFKVSLDKSNNLATATVFPDRTYTIKAVALIEPTITYVRNSKNVEIPQGGTTADTTVKLTGRATANLQVQILVNGTIKDTVTIDSTGEWNYTLTGLTVAAHSITAKATYGSLPVSLARTFRVVQKIQIPTTHMGLNGIKLIQDFGWTEKDAPGTTETRQATAGTPPYRYTSQNPSVATVGATDGKVRARGNGTTIITVTDSNGDSLSYTVSASRVCRLIRSPTPLSGPAAVSWNYANPESGGLGYVPFLFPSQFQDLTQIYAPIGEAGSIYTTFYPAHVTPPYGGLFETWATSPTTTTDRSIAAPPYSRFAYTFQLLNGH